MFGVTERMGPGEEMTMEQSRRQDVAQRQLEKKQAERKTSEDKMLQEWSDAYEEWEGKNPTASAVLRTADLLLVPKTKTDVALMLAAGPVLKGAVKAAKAGTAASKEALRRLISSRSGEEVAEETIESLTELGRKLNPDIGELARKLMPEPQMRRGMARIPGGPKGPKGPDDNVVEFKPKNRNVIEFRPKRREAERPQQPLIPATTPATFGSDEMDMLLVQPHVVRRNLENLTPDQQGAVNSLLLDLRQLKIKEQHDIVLRDLKNNRNRIRKLRKELKGPVRSPEAREQIKMEADSLEEFNNFLAKEANKLRDDLNPTPETFTQAMFDAEKISLIRELGMELSTASGKRFGEARETLLTRLIEKKAGSIKALQSLARRGKLGPTKESDILDINQALFLIQQAARKAPK
jgi:hypothetical protein